MSKGQRITVAEGDGIGPEIMTAVLNILKEAGAQIEIDPVLAGSEAYKCGYGSGLTPASWDSVLESRIFFKGPTSTPNGATSRSVAVTIRKTLGLFANIRPCKSYTSIASSRHPRMDVVIIHENEENAYAGIEYRQSPDVAYCMNIASMTGSRRLANYAFQYASVRKARLLSCFTKRNIVKFVDGAMALAFDAAALASDMPTEHMTVDTAFANFSVKPEAFDVIVLSSVYGDILSDIGAKFTGSVGLGYSAAIGWDYAMFEASHGSFPQRANANCANPSGLLLSGITMLNYIGQPDVGQRAYQAWLRTLEDGVHTYDISTKNDTLSSVGTSEFASAVVRRLGMSPQYSTEPDLATPPKPVKPKSEAQTANARSIVIGADISIQFDHLDVSGLLRLTELPLDSEMKLDGISNRGTLVWPHTVGATITSDLWCCRYVHKHGATSRDVIMELAQMLTHRGLIINGVEVLCNIDGSPGYYMPI